jgi:hypothetical protein
MAVDIGGFNASAEAAHEKRKHRPLVTVEGMNQLNTQTDK